MVVAWPSQSEVDAYTAQRAAELGIDPGAAVRVRRSESGSGFVGDHGSSFGPFQFHYGGIASGGNAGKGLGDDFTTITGLNARDPSTWRQQVDFALTHAKHNGWGVFHGAALAGIGIWDGITGSFNGGEIKEGVQSGVNGILNEAYQGLTTYTQNRAASIVLLTIGIVLVLFSAWSFLNQIPVVRQTIGTAKDIAGVAALAA